MTTRPRSLALPIAGLLAFALPPGAGIANARPATPQEVRAARAVVARWLEAQDAADFEAYQALYAPAFAGVKRVGETSRQMNRAAWMADRKAMFRSPMRVRAQGIVVSADGGALVVEFEQTWEQGTFADSGRKRLVLDPAKAAAGAPGPIAGEEMLSSRVVPSRLACLRSLHPQAPASGRRVDEEPDADAVDAIEVIDLGRGFFACLVESSAGAGASTTELAFLKRGKGWVVVASQEHRFDVTRNPDEESASGGQVTVTPIPMTGTETAALVEVARESSGPMHEAGRKNSMLYRVTDAGLDELIDFESVWDKGEADRETRCELEVDRSRRGGPPDLVVHCTELTGDWHDPDVEKRGITESSSKTRYRWDGNRYLESPPVP